MGCKGTRRGAIWIIVSAVTSVALVACGSESDLKPTRADVLVTGESSVPLRIIVSTDFIETIDQVTFERGQSFLDADTVFIQSLPYQDAIALTEDASIVVDVSNPSDIPATVRLQVNLDTNQDSYDREATMSEGGALRYVFSFFSPRL